MNTNASRKLTLVSYKNLFTYPYGTNSQLQNDTEIQGWNHDFNIRLESQQFKRKSRDIHANHNKYIVAQSELILTIYKLL